MTRSEFNEEVCDFSSLFYFCCEYLHADFVQDYFHEGDLQDQIRDDIDDTLRYEDWETIRDSLYGIETGYSWYLRNGCLNYEPVRDEDNEFDYLIGDVIERLELDGFFEDEEEDAEEDEEYDGLALAQSITSNLVPNGCVRSVPNEN